LIRAYEIAQALKNRREKCIGLDIVFIVLSHPKPGHFCARPIFQSKLPITDEPQAGNAPGKAVHLAG
jgi:hypothetical protein